GENGIGILLDLGLIEVRRVECRSAHDGELRRLPGTVRNFEITVVTAGKQYESAGIVDDVRRIPKHSILVGVVVERIGAARWVLDPDTVVQVTPGPIIIQLPFHTAVLKARHNRVEASTIDRRITLFENGAALRVNVDHPGRSKSKLR